MATSAAPEVAIITISLCMGFAVMQTTQTWRLNEIMIQVTRSSMMVFEAMVIPRSALVTREKSLARRAYG